MPSDHNPETGSTHLKRMILSQAVEGAAIPVVLFSSDTLAAGSQGAAGDDRAAGDHRGDQPEVVAQAAAGLDIDPDALGLFTFDAYRLQSALGQRLAP